MAIKLDTSGKDCPIPLMELKQALSASDSGETVDLTFTCPEALDNIPNYCQENNHEILKFEKVENKGWNIIVKN